MDKQHAANRCRAKHQAVRGALSLSDVRSFHQKMISWSCGSTYDEGTQATTGSADVLVRKMSEANILRGERRGRGRPRSQ
jgi:hypothetical protein